MNSLSANIKGLVIFLAAQTGQLRLARDLARFSGSLLINELFGLYFAIRSPPFKLYNLHKKLTCPDQEHKIIPVGLYKLPAPGFIFSLSPTILIKSKAHNHQLILLQETLSHLLCHFDQKNKK